MLVDQQSRTSHGGGLSQDYFPSCPLSTESTQKNKAPSTLSASLNPVSTDGSLLGPVSLAETATVAKTLTTVQPEATTTSTFSSESLCTSLLTPPVQTLPATTPPPPNRRLSTSSTLSERLLELADPVHKRLDFSRVSSPSPPLGATTSKSAIFSEPGLPQPRLARVLPHDSSPVDMECQTPSDFLMPWKCRQQPQPQHQAYPRTINQFLHQVHPVNLSTKFTHLEERCPLKPVTSIVGSNRCLWPSDAAFWSTTRSSCSEPDRRTSRGTSQGNSISKSTSGRDSYTPEPIFNITFSRHHERADSFKDTSDSIQALQPRRKARRVLDAPSFKEKSHNIVSGHVHKLIQEAVEDGVGELDLSYLDLYDLPAEIKDLNYAIVYNERGSFSLSNNRLKLFLSSNLFSTIPMDVFALHNLSILSLRNNNIETIPPEIGLLHNLVELSVGGNRLRFLPSQIVLLPKLHILTIHPNPFLNPSEPSVPQSSVEVAQLAPNVTVEADIQGGTTLPSSTDSLATVSAHPTPSNLLTSGPCNTQSDISMAATPSQSHNSVMPAPPSQLSSDSRETVPSHSTHRLPLHQVKRSTKIPSLLILAGSTILNYMAQQASQTSVRSKADGKPSIEGNDIATPSAAMSALSNAKIPQHTRKVPSQPGLTSYQKRRLEEETIKSNLTPYLYDIFKRARVNNKCQGCHNFFWKPCSILIVWQDILGQTQVPIKWKGCGQGGCLGVSANVLVPLEDPLSAEQQSALSGTSSEMEARAMEVDEQP